MKKINFIYLILSTAFAVIGVISNIISAKMIQLPLLHRVSIPCGLMTYPLTFLLLNFVTEIYGKNLARRMIYSSMGMIVLSFALIQIALALPAETLDGQQSFQTVMGLGGFRLFSSLSASFIAQRIDIQLYAFICRLTKGRFLWLRNHGSILFSLLIDTVIVDLIFLYGGLRMGLDQVVQIMLFSYFYKVLFSVVNTPLLYLCCFFLKKRRRMFYG